MLVAAAQVTSKLLIVAAIGVPVAANAQEEWLRATVETCTDTQLDTPERGQSLLDQGWSSLAWPEDVHPFAIQSQGIIRLTYHAASSSLRASDEVTCRGQEQSRSQQADVP